MTNRANPLITLVITEDGQVEIVPGPSFDDSHLDLMVKAHAGVVTALAAAK